jgi:fatty acid desaturase
MQLFTGPGIGLPTGARQRRWITVTSREAAEIRQLSRPTDTRLARIALHAFLLTLAMAVVLSADGVVRVAAQLVAASQLISLYTLMHQAAHGSVASSRRVNRVVGTALGLLLGTSFSGYRACHLAHHRYLREERDPQEAVYPSYPRRVPMAVTLAIASVLGAAIFMWVRIPVTGARFGRRRAVYAEFFAAVAFHATVLLLVVPRDALLPLLGVVVIAVIWGSAIDIVYHQGLPMTGGPESCRSLRSDWFGRLVLNGENWHAEHHAYPAVPGNNLRHLARLIGPRLRRSGAVYESGYFRAFFLGLVRAPAFLPPRSEPNMTRASTSVPSSESS